MTQNIKASIPKEGNTFDSVKEATKDLEKLKFQVDYTSKDYEEREFSTLFDKFESKLNVMSEEELNELFDFFKTTDNRPKLDEVYSDTVTVYEGSCKTHYVTICVRGYHNIEEITKMFPFNAIEELHLEEIWILNPECEEYRLATDECYNIIATFEPYEPECLGLDNEKGTMFSEQDNSFQVRLKTKEEICRQYFNSME